LEATLTHDKRNSYCNPKDHWTQPKYQLSKYHCILNDLNWSPKQGAFILLKMILKRLGDERAVTLIDETLERPKDKRIPGIFSLSKTKFSSDLGILS